MSAAQKNGNEQPAKSPKDEPKKRAAQDNNMLATGLCGRHRKKSSAGGEMVAPRQQYKFTNVLDSEDKARIFFFWRSERMSDRFRTSVTKGRVRALKGRTRKGPRNTLKRRQRNVRGNWIRQQVRQHYPGKKEKAERTPDVSCVVTRTINCLLGHPEMTKKRSRPRQPQVKSSWSVRRHRLKSSADGSRATQKHKTHDAGRSLVGVQQTLLAAFRVCRSTSLLRVRPENLRWSHCS